MLRNTVFYLAANIINKAIPFLLIPYFTQHLTTAQYGALAIFQVFVSFSTPIVGLNLPTHITRNFYTLDHEALAKLITCVLALLITSTTIFTIIYYCISLTNLAIWEPIGSKWLAATPIICGLLAINQINLSVYRNQEKALKYGLSEITRTAINASISIILISIYSQGWEGIAIANLLSTAALSTVGIISLYNSKLLRLSLSSFQKSKVKDALYIGATLIPHSISSSIITYSDRLIISHYLGESDVGIYSLGYQVASIANIIIDSIILAWSPYFYRNIDSKKLSITKYIYALSIIFLAVSLFTYISGTFFIHNFINNNYIDANTVLLPISLSFFSYGLYKLLFPFLVHKGKTATLSLISASSGAINIILNVILIPKIGTLGAAYSTLISYIVVTAMLFIFVNKSVPMPWTLKRK
ncbi:polysaccharide biosynthesis protein [Hahella chejuensis KCTC 2396]|uniref:Polysaccharide biosynthesis protein n=1 Tax=Hahella chejuensis (strain KCTC 2396) TaxID=349521 RepID=Q2SBN1_HAHCH|nr:oligosaccharide flippase family protein [Hahella chejuensis]ABC31943.1 polysaccharide biosynthesis protein [Hahella chejuensis KCTC 2396]